MKNLETLITTCVELGTSRAFELMGVHSGEISQRKARDTYGKWFVEAVNAGRIRPCRVDDGKSGTKRFRIVDILELKAKDAARADLTI